MIYIKKKKSSTLLADVTFEDIMSEEAISSCETGRGKEADRSSISFSIIKNYGKLSEKKRTATFALVNWNGHNCYDLRRWSNDYSTPYKGITFSKDEIPILFKALSEYTYIGDNEPKHLYSIGNAEAKIFDVVCMLSNSTIRGKKWCKQVCIIDWGYGKKYDFRKWTEDYDKCSKGICLSKEETEELRLLLGDL